MYAKKDSKIVVERDVRYQASDGSWRIGAPKILGTFWANARGVKHEAEFVAASYQETPSLVFTLAQPRLIEFEPGDRVWYRDKAYQVTYVDFLDNRPGSDVKLYAKEL